MSDTANLSQPTGSRYDGGPGGGTGIIGAEPALFIGGVTALVDAGLVLLFVFVTSFSAEQQAAILAFATAVVSMLSALVTRTQVSPAAKIQQ